MNVLKHQIWVSSSVVEVWLCLNICLVRGLWDFSWSPIRGQCNLKIPRYPGWIWSPNLGLWWRLRLASMLISHIFTSSIRSINLMWFKKATVVVNVAEGQFTKCNHFRNHSVLPSVHGVRRDGDAAARGATDSVYSLIYYNLFLFWESGCVGFEKMISMWVW